MPIGSQCGTDGMGKRYSFAQRDAHESFETLGGRRRRVKDGRRVFPDDYWASNTSVRNASSLPMFAALLALGQRKNKQASLAKVAIATVPSIMETGNLPAASKFPCRAQGFRRTYRMGSALRVGCGSVGTSYGAYRPQIICRRCNEARSP
jgi:hypothetical protein